MFKKTTRQTSLMENALWLGDAAQARLHATWADGFRLKVMPVLLEAEAEFSALYAKVGRPNWSTARMLGCLLLQELENKSDQQVVDALAFDIRYHHALGLAGNEAYLSRRSLVGFRGRLLRYEGAMELVRDLFDRICRTICAELDLSTKEQRTDSTWIISNIRIRGRLGLFRQTVRQFVMWLEKTAPADLPRLSQGLRTWHEEFDDSWEQPKETAKHRPLILQLARWAYEIEQEFAGDDAVTSQEPYQLLERLLREQCIITRRGEGDGGDADSARGKVELTIHDTLQKGDGAMRTPHDPDATTGRKGVGYHVQVTETCNNDRGCEVITDFEVGPAHIPDTGRSPSTVERMAERGMQPETLYSDAGYPTPASLARNEDLGTQLHAPVNRRNMPKDKLSRMDFTVEEDTGSILVCPQGHVPVAHTERAVTPERRAPFALFDHATCSACPQLKSCPVQSPGEARTNTPFRLEESKGLYIRDRLYIEQRSPEWREAQKIRAGIEATNSELKRAHGFGRLRVRRRARVNLVVALKLTACNVKRWLKHVLTTETTVQEPALQAA